LRNESFALTQLSGVFFMDDLQKIRAALVVMEKKTSLRQVAIQSGINYITLRNIKSGRSGRVTDGVITRFAAFEQQFAAAPEATTVRRGRKAAAAPAPTPVKAGRKAKAVVEPTVAVEAPAPVKVVGKAKPAAKAKPAVKAKGRPAAPKAVAPKAVAPKPVASLPEPSTSLLGGTLTKEIELAEARLDFLKQLQKLEADFLKKIGK
jgi:hypothetical protein